MTLLALAIFFFGTVAICCTVLGLAIHVWSAPAQQDCTEDCEEDDAESVVSMTLGLAIQVWSAAAQQDCTEDWEEDDAESVFSMTFDDDDATTMPMPSAILQPQSDSEWEFPSPAGRHSRTLKVRQKRNSAKFH